MCGRASRWPRLGRARCGPGVQDVDPLPDERGAVVLVVAFSLVVLVGMLVLVFDLGSMIARRREMVRAADAAALSAAQSCAVDSLAGEDPEAKADELALDNVPALTDATSPVGTSWRSPAVRPPVDG